MTVSVSPTSFHQAHSTLAVPNAIVRATVALVVVVVSANQHGFVDSTGLWVGPEISPTEEVAQMMWEARNQLRLFDNRCLARVSSDDMDTAEPSFWLVQQHGGDDKLLKASSTGQHIMEAGFRPNLSTTIVVGGYTQSITRTFYLKTIKKGYMKHRLIDEENLLFMEHRKSMGNTHEKAASMSSIVAAGGSVFIRRLLELGADPNRMQIIGAAMGSHIAGFMARLVKPRIGRIVALDPSSNCFRRKLRHLEPTDAIEVQVWHTDDGLFGSKGQLGTHDIYLNGGRVQPDSRGRLRSLLNVYTNTCFGGSNEHTSDAHVWPQILLQADLTEKSNGVCQEVAYECENYRKFEQGFCGHCGSFNQHCALISFRWQHPITGWQVPRGLMFAKARGDTQQSLVDVPRQQPSKRMFIKTGAEYPHCLNHWQVQINLKHEIDESLHKGWKMVLQLMPQRGPPEIIVLKHQLDADTYSHLWTSDTRPTPVKRAVLASREHSIFPGLPDIRPPKIEVQDIQIDYMSNIDVNVRKSLSTRLCLDVWSDEEASEMLEGNSQVFRPCEERDSFLPSSSARVDDVLPGWIGETPPSSPQSH